MYNLERKHQAVLLVVLALVLFGAGYKFASVTGDDQGDAFLDAGAGKSTATPALEETGRAKEKEGEKEIMVHVVGAVEMPGVFTLPAGSRVVDAVEAAVPSPQARLDILNLAAPLADGQQVAVWSDQEYREYLSAAKGPGKSGPAGGAQPALPGAAGLQPGKNSSGLININTAGQERLERLPGIGPALAGRIIDHRKANGRFLSIADIKNVSGIGEKRFEQIRDQITVN